MTLGETYVYNKENFIIKDGYAIFPIQDLPKRMPSKKAMKYYTEKLNKVWEELGYETEQYKAKKENEIIIAKIVIIPIQKF